MRARHPSLPVHPCCRAALPCTTTAGAPRVPCRACRCLTLRTALVCLCRADTNIRWLRQPYYAACNMCQMHAAPAVLAPAPLPCRRCICERNSRRIRAVRLWFTAELGTERCLFVWPMRADFERPVHACKMSSRSEPNSSEKPVSYIFRNATLFLCAGAAHGRCERVYYAVGNGLDLG